MTTIKVLGCVAKKFFEVTQSEGDMKDYLEKHLAKEIDASPW
jgi:hypothetical protein